jgi:hypothetical protein
LFDISESKVFLPAAKQQVVKRSIGRIKLRNIFSQNKNVTDG